MKNFLTLLCQLSLFGISVAQPTMKEFPQNVDLNDYKSCTFDFDTAAIKNTIAEIDFEGERLDYDYSRIELVDLNDDGKCEVLHMFSSGVRGWPQDFLTIYKIESNVPSKLFDGSSYFMEFAESDGEYLQINYTRMEGHKTNPKYKNTVWRFDSDKYKPSYSSDLSRGEMKTKGLELYNSGDYSNALIYFKNVLVFRHPSGSKLLSSANDVAITLIKLKRFEEVESFLLPYMSKTKDKRALASSYFNLGLSKELDNDFADAVKYFKKSYQYNPTTVAKEKIERYER